MRQSEVVEVTEWSKAKVSRLLSEMERAGEIIRMQVGREKRVWREGEQPELIKPLSEANVNDISSKGVSTCRLLTANQTIPPSPLISAGVPVAKTTQCDAIHGRGEG
jgi:hypothetical protein